MARFKSRLKHRPVILLSFCDGIGSARLALEWLSGSPKLSMACEIDADCLKVTRHWFPAMIHSFVNDNYQEVAQIIKERDPRTECLILVTAGTPCPDYSVVSGKKEGCNHPEGAKFGEFIDRVRGLIEALPDHRFMTVAENVIMNDPTDCEFISQKMGADPIMVDGGDSLSFLDHAIQWQEMKTHPLTGNKIQWTQHNGHRQVKLSLPQQEASNFTMGCLRFHDQIVQGRKRIPCFTRPALTFRGGLLPRRTD